MRVITGSARGRRLAEPDGLQIRPTTDRVKEGLFSAIQFDIETRRVLDLFAGTGQLGIECLSRGAERAVFVDSAPESLSAVRENLRRTGLTGKASVIPSEATAYLSGTREKFDLIFLDPPYDSGLLEQALECIVTFDILTPYGIIAAEHPAGARFPMPPLPLRAVRTYRYGKIAVTVFRRDPEAHSCNPYAESTKL